VKYLTNSLTDWISANYDALKIIITDDTINVNQKNTPMRVTENTANFIFITAIQSLSQTLIEGILYRAAVTVTVTAVISHIIHQQRRE
jgi:hypothetical protein